jgi:hypothetical protein
MFSYDTYLRIPESRMMRALECTAPEACRARRARSRPYLARGGSSTSTATEMKSQNCCERGYKYTYKQDAKAEFQKFGDSAKNIRKWRLLEKTDAAAAPSATHDNAPPRLRKNRHRSFPRVGQRLEGAPQTTTNVEGDNRCTGCARCIASADKNDACCCSWGIRN